MVSLCEVAAELVEPFELGWLFDSFGDGGEVERCAEAEDDGHQAVFGAAAAEVIGEGFRDLDAVCWEAVDVFE